MATGHGNEVYVPSWIYWVLGGALALMFLAMIFLSYTAPQENNAFSSPGSRAITDILTNPDRHLGRTVTIQAPVAAEVSGNAFLAGEIYGPNSAAILVITPNGLPPTPPVGQNVVITGVVRRMDLETAQQYIPAGFDPAIVSQYSGQPAIFATAVRAVNR